MRKTAMKKLMLTLAVASLCAGVAHAADKPKADTGSPPAGMPAYGKDKALPTPHIVKQTLANGLQVWVVPRTGVPRVDLVLAVRDAGLAADDAAHPGFASLLAGLLNEGTAKHDSSASSIPSQAAPMMALLAEVVRTPSFPAPEVALARTNALQALRVSEAQPQYRAERAMARAVYGDHPYGHLMPTAASIEGTTEELLRTEHAKRIRPERALLVITGRIGEADALKLAQDAFGDWKASTPAAPEAPKTKFGDVKPARLLLDRGGSVQSTVRLGSPGIAATAPDQIPLRLASDILGGGFSNRVNLNLREEKGYTYGARAGARLLREGGSISGGADVRNDVTGAALGEFLKEYKRIGTDLVAPDEMRMHKRYVAGSYLLSNQMQRAVAATLAQNWLVGLPSEFLGEYVPRIQKVTPEQVRTVSKKYFAPENQAIVVVGDAKAVGEQLKAFGDFTVTAQ
jgi:zinc protease